MFFRNVLRITLEQETIHEDPFSVFIIKPGKGQISSPSPIAVMNLDYRQFSTGPHFNLGSLGHFYFCKSMDWHPLCALLCNCYINNHNFKDRLMSRREQAVVAGLCHKLLLQESFPSSFLTMLSAS